MPLDIDLSKAKADKEAKRGKFMPKVKKYAIIALIIYLGYWSSLYSITAVETEGYTTHVLCIGVSNVANDFKCYQEFTSTSRF